jgi:hypothetical protein
MYSIMIPSLNKMRTLKPILTVIVVTVFECHRAVLPGMIEIWPSSSAAERAERHIVTVNARQPAPVSETLVRVLPSTNAVGLQ